MSSQTLPRSIAPVPLSRRRVLQGGLVIGFAIAAPRAGFAADGEATPTGATVKALDPTEIDSWLSVDAKGKVTVFFGKVDMGQGSDVAMGQIVAEELDVPFSSVAVVQGDTLLTINQGDASGSFAVSHAGPALRVAAAEARKVLLDRAAASWGVGADQVTVQNGIVSFTADPKKTITYAKLVGGKHFNAKVGWNNQIGNTLILTGQAKPKTPDQYKIVGTSPPRYDIPGKVFGTLDYVTDIRVPGMVHGRIIRPAVAGSVPVSVDESSIAGIPGARVVRKGDFLAVVADKEWNAIRASQKLKVTWSDAPNAFPDMAAIYNHIRQAPSTKSDAPVNVGKVDDALPRAAKVMSADYEWPFQSHASMGPACAVVDARPDGATVWSGTQKPHFASLGVAKILNLPPEKVRTIWVHGPGAYGRNDAGDALMEAAVLSQAVGKPVRVQYSRNEGTGWDPKGPASVHRIRAGLDASGKIIAWDFLSRGFSRYDVAQIENDPGETLVGQMMGAKPQLAPAFAIAEDNYVFENKRVGWDTIPPLLDKVSPLRTAHMRDPLGPQCHFASECFFDDIAAATNADPVAMRLSYLREERDIAVIKAAAEKAGWKAGPLGARRGKNGNLLTGQGIAYTQRNALGVTTYVCIVSDVEVDPATGRVHVKRFTVAHDCGLIINPETLKRVIEGNVVQGLSRAMHEETTFDARSVTGVDWATYPILEIGDTPDEIDIVLINRPTVKSSGAGEGAIRTVAASLNNAIYEATGIRIRRAPLTPARVKAALTSA